jgi:hypothetical protein
VSRQPGGAAEARPPGASRLVAGWSSALGEISAADDAEMQGRIEEAAALRTREARLDLANRLYTDFVRRQPGRYRRLTVTCLDQHALVTVYEVARTLIWVGRETVQSTVDPSESLRDKGVRRRLRRRTRVDVVSGDRSPFVGVFDQPRGSCKCSAHNQSVERTWLREQAELQDTELPTGRRVVLPRLRTSGLH